MKTNSKQWEAQVLPTEQLYRISGGNDGTCDPTACYVYDAGIWVGEAIDVMIKILGFIRIGRSIRP